MKKITQTDIIKEYFIKNPNRDIYHKEIVPWIAREYKKRTGKVFADTDRQIRTLSQTGFLIKVTKGVYRYDPEFVENRELEDFTPKQKEEIFRQDGYKCVKCGRGKNEGYELHADHILAKDKGGKAEVSNGQTLCSVCNFRKKNYGQTESGKRMFIRLYETARKINDKHTIDFLEEVLSAYGKYDINGHIEWKK
jgi:hypothetical protein